jgi:hypothetical protein
MCQHLDEKDSWLSFRLSLRDDQASTLGLLMYRRLPVLKRFGHTDDFWC